MTCLFGIIKDDLVGVVLQKPMIDTFEQLNILEPSDELLCGSPASSRLHLIQVDTYYTSKMMYSLLHLSARMNVGRVDRTVENLVADVPRTATEVNMLTQATFTLPPVRLTLQPYIGTIPLSM